MASATFVFALSASTLAGCRGHNTLGDADELRESFAKFDEKGHEKVRWLADYRRAKSRCAWDEDAATFEYHYDWFPTDEGMRSSYWSYLASQMLITTYYPNFPLWLKEFFHYLFRPEAHGPALQSYTCQVADGKEGEFRIRKLGPFVSKGGFDWHKMKLEDPYNLGSLIRQHGEIHVTGFMAAPFAEGGEMLGMPPVHIHHANLGPNDGSSLSRLSQWHGDSQCAASEGGTACYITTLPRSFGFPVSRKLRLDIDFNDVRPKDSPEMRFWLESAIRIAKPAGATPQSHDVGTVIIGVPFRMNWWKSSDLQRLYFVPPNQASALWVTARLPVAGTFVAGKLETHQHMFDQAWVFSGVSPEDLGLNTGAWALQRPWLPWLPTENGWTNDALAMQALKRRVLTNFEAAGLRCADAGCKKTPTWVWTLNKTMIEGGEEREMPWPKTNWSFEQQEQFTIIIFHKAMGMAMPSEVKELSQHLAITGHYIPRAGDRGRYIFVLPSSRAEWAWFDSVSWLAALTHAGGPPDDFWCWGGALLVLCVWLLACTFSCCCATLARRKACACRAKKYLAVSGQADDSNVV